MSLLKIGIVSSVAYGLYRYVTTRSDSEMPRAAFASGESTPGTIEVRNAGPAAMAGEQPRWDKVDQASDESYPASDPPASNRFT
ncbi:hypothetical protein [Novosphingobium sp.]|uniref:hypothetical protein n=1 Tax=Novosphingobium sp. TaxID=1874826 RepID=UPI003B52AA6F